MFVLGALQGLLGWYMVKSGLVDDPRVSQYRLTAHLAAALAIYGYMFWVALELLRPAGESATPRPGPRLKRWAAGVAALVVLVVVSGGFVAGLKAGYVFNTFPLMGERWMPESMYAMAPFYRNWFENVSTVQFNHRVLALLGLASVAALWLWGRRSQLSGSARLWLDASMVMAAGQVALGIATLVLRVPVGPAATHQPGAIVLFTLLVGLNYELRR